MQAMCSEEGQDVFEEILEMISYFTYFSPEVPFNRLLDSAHRVAHCMLCGPHGTSYIASLTKLCAVPGNSCYRTELAKSCLSKKKSSLKGPSCLLVLFFYEALL